MKAGCRYERRRFCVIGKGLLNEGLRLRPWLDIDERATGQLPAGAPIGGVCVSSAISVEPLADGIGGDHVGYWTGSHVPKKKFIGACLNAYKHDIGDNVGALFEAEVKHAFWRETHECQSCRDEEEPWPKCSWCRGTGQMYDYMLLPAEPEEQGAFPVTFVYFE